MSGPTGAAADERSALLSATLTTDRRQQYGSTSPSSDQSETPKLANSTTVDVHEAPSKTVIWTVFPVLLIGVFLSNVVSSVVLATNQHIASEFDALAGAAWLLTIYTLAQSASQPLYGKLSDIFGRRKCLIFCWTVFGIGCLLSGIGTAYWHVILGRAISGVGSAGKIALTSVVVADLVPLDQVATYRAYVNLTATIARSLGGPIGGWLAGSVGWRWPFLIQMPLAVIGLLLVLWKLPEKPASSASPVKNTSEIPSDGLKVPSIPADTLVEVHDSTFEPDSGPRPTSEEKQATKQSSMSRVDFGGAITLVCTITSGMLALDSLTASRPQILTAFLAIASLLSLTAFIYIERSIAREPILPLPLLLRRDVLTAYGVIALQSAAQFGLLYSIPIYFQLVQRESVSRAATRIVPVVAGNAVGTIASGRLIARQKRYKLLTGFANVAGCTGFVLLATRWTGVLDNEWEKTLYVVLPGMGMGIVQSASFIHLAASVEKQEMAIAASVWFLAQNLGVLVGASASISLINGVLQHGLESALYEGRLPGADTETIRKAMSSFDYTQNLPEDLRTVVIGEYVHSLRYSDGLSVLLTAAALLVTFTMREKPL